VFVAALYLAAFILSRNRPRTTIIIGAVLAANALLVGLMLAIGQQLFVNQLAGTVFGPASRVFYEQLLSYLERGQRVMLWLGLVLVIVGWFAGRNAPATAARSTVRGGLEAVGAQLGDTSAAGAGRWVAANAGWLRYAVGVLGAVVLLWGNDISVARLFWSLGLVVVLLMAVQVFVGVGRGPRRASPEPVPV
jgi:hypothetical protein